MRIFHALSASLLLAMALPMTALGQVKVDPKLPTYKAVAGVSGTIKSVGSDTMNNLMTFWSEGFKKFYPNVRVEVEGKGTSTGPVALKEGTANFAPASRPFKKGEIDDFEKKFGYKPTELGTSIDMLAVFVNKDNPLESLTLQQVDAIFSKTRKGGAEKDITKWGQLGVLGTLEKSPISLYGRNSASGTYGFFKEHALFGGDFKPTVKELPGSAAVVQAVASDKTGIGYSGIGFLTADVRPVPLAKDEDSKFIPPTIEYAYGGQYPLSRLLNVGVNYKPGSKLDPLWAEFLKFVYSKQGQEIVVKDGYFPVTATLATKMLQKVGIKPQP